MVVNAIDLTSRGSSIEWRPASRDGVQSWSASIAGARAWVVEDGDRCVWLACRSELIRPFLMGEAGSLDSALAEVEAVMFGVE